MTEKLTRILAFLAVCLLLSACWQISVGEDGNAVGASLSQDYDSRIDAAFSTGKIVFGEKEIPKPDPDTCEITAVPQGQESAELVLPDEARIREELRTGEFYISAYSPSGKTAVGYVKSAEDLLQIPLIISGSQVRMIYPSRTRGAEAGITGAESYYTRNYCQGCGGQKIVSISTPLGIDYQGLVWSPDERYYYAPNYTYTIYNSKSNHFIVDTQTGELIALDSFGGEWNDEDFGRVYNGCFSSDGRYFYGSYRGNKYGENNSFGLIRYDLETYEAQPLAGMNETAAAMAALRNGEILAFEWQFKAEEKQPVDRISPDGAVVTGTLPMKSQTWYALNMKYSPKSGWALIRGFSDLVGQYTTEPITGLGIQAVRPDGSEPMDLDTALFVDNESGELVSASVKERFYGADGAEEIQNVRKYNGRGYDILDMELSPDGRYAAMLVFRMRDSRFDTETELKCLIIRLEDHACLVAEGLDIYEDPGKLKAEKGQILAGYASLRGKKRMSVLNWTEAGLLTNCSKTQMWDIE